MPSLPSAKSGNKEMWPPPSCQASPWNRSCSLVLAIALTGWAAASCFANSFDRQHHATGVIGKRFWQQKLGRSPGSGQPSDGMPTLPASELPQSKVETSSTRFLTSRGHPPAQPSSLAAPQTPPERPEPPTGACLKADPGILEEVWQFSGAAPQPAWGLVLGIQ